jgi:hypothetical protein
MPGVGDIPLNVKLGSENSSKGGGTQERHEKKGQRADGESVQSIAEALIAPTPG